MKLLQQSRSLCYTAAFMLSAVLSACGGSSDQGRDPVLGLGAAELVSVSVTPPSSTILAGTSQQLTATASYSDGSSRNVTTLSTWTAATPTVASVSSGTGLANGLTAGSTAINAAFGARSGTATVAVTVPVPVPAPAPVLSSIAVTPITSSILVGRTQQYIAVATYSDNSTAVMTNGVTWSSGSGAIAGIVPSGMATGIAPGVSIITASSGVKSGTATLTVAALPVAPVVLVPPPVVPPAPPPVVPPAPPPVVPPAPPPVVPPAPPPVVPPAPPPVVPPAPPPVVPPAPPPVVPPAPPPVVPPAPPPVVPPAPPPVVPPAPPPVVPPAPPPVVPPAPVPVVAPVALGRAANFAVLAGTALTNNSGGTTFVTGDVGSPSQTTDPTQAAGFANYKSGAILAGALEDLDLAVTDANSRPCSVISGAGINLGGLTLPPGVYCYGGAITITGTFQMAGPGVYIFRSGTTLDTTANATIALTGGADAANVFWVPVGATTLAANTTFKGSILARAAAITAGDNTTLLNGRVLSTAAVTLRNNQITK